MGSPFASMTISDPIPLPFDEGQWVRVRALTGDEYKESQVAHRVKFVNGDKWAGLFREISARGVSNELLERALADPLTGFDRYTVARLGLVEWSYPQPLTRIEGKPAVPATDTTPEQPAVLVVDAVGDLKDDPIEFIAREILRRSKPSLFVTTMEEGEAAQKKADGVSPVFEGSSADSDSAQVRAAV